MKVVIDLSNVEECDKESAAVVVQFDGQEIDVMDEIEMNMWTEGEEEKLYLFSCIDWDSYAYVLPIGNSDCYSFKKEWVKEINA